MSDPMSDPMSDSAQPLNPDKLPWDVIDAYFTEYPLALVQHHIDSYNAFLKTDILEMFKPPNNVIEVFFPSNEKEKETEKKKETKKETKNEGRRLKIYLGGKNGKNVRIKRQMDNKYPNDYRDTLTTYAVEVSYQIDMQLSTDGPTDKPQVDGKTQADGKTQVDGKPQLDGKTQAVWCEVPLMLWSDKCVLKEQNLNSYQLHAVGESKHELGGYFIIDGHEKCLVSQETRAENLLFLNDKAEDPYSHSVQINSVPTDLTRRRMPFALKFVTPQAACSYSQIVAIIPNVRAPIPLFVLMRALGVLSDKAIIERCLLDLDKYSNNYLEFFRPSIHHAGQIFTQGQAIDYIYLFMTYDGVDGSDYVLNVLYHFLLPHVGVDNLNEKAFFVGYMVNELILLMKNVIPATDKDSFRYKRVEPAGVLLRNLFADAFSKQKNSIRLAIESAYLKDHKIRVDHENVVAFCNQSQIVTTKFIRQGFKGDWGVSPYNKINGVSQPLNRFNYNATLSHLRLISRPSKSKAYANMKPFQLHASQWGMLDPLDIAGDGLQKRLALMARVTVKMNTETMLENAKNIKELSTKWFSGAASIGTASIGTASLGISPADLKSKLMCKIIINGHWKGVMLDTTPEKVKKLIQCFTNPAQSDSLIFNSGYWDITRQVIFIQTDGGRLCRPVFGPVFANDALQKKIKGNDWTWANFIKQGVVTYLDNSSTEGAYIARELRRMKDQDKKNMRSVLAHSSTRADRYTHAEIHPAIHLGVLGNQITFPEYNQYPRNTFSCAHAQQAVSVFHCDESQRYETSSMALNFAQVPLVKSRLMQYINKEAFPSGVNAIVAVLSSNGYNVEDSIMINAGSIKRGMFATTVAKTYVGEIEEDEQFFAFTSKGLTKDGVLEVGQAVAQKQVLIGKKKKRVEDQTTLDLADLEDLSIKAKRGAKGFVTKTLHTPKVNKVSVTEHRLPIVGDKFSSRCGQKGVLGLVIPEIDMPFTAEGVRPDLIINPHAFPSRMTLGQLIETIVAKACAFHGAAGDCTAFVNANTDFSWLTPLLQEHNLHSSGNELLYNGETGEQYAMDIYLGPTYYQRLKYMVEDKINARDTGSGTQLTRQVQQGRANDGGLRMGEMERDCLVAHGLNKFMNNILITHGELHEKAFELPICNRTGLIAIYNPALNIFVSPTLEKNTKDRLNQEKLEKYFPKDSTKPALENLQSPDCVALLDKVAQFQQEISMVQVPYAFKLLLQELTTMNVQLRIITSDNVNAFATGKADDKADGDLFSPDTQDEQSNEKSNEKSKEKSKENLGESNSVYGDLYSVYENRSATGNSPIFSPTSPSYHPTSPTFSPFPIKLQNIGPGTVSFNEESNVITGKNTNFLAEGFLPEKELDFFALNKFSLPKLVGFIATVTPTEIRLQDMATFTNVDTQYLLPDYSKYETE